jgi:hypothetical protein
VLQSSYVSGLTLVVGANPPAALVAATDGTADPSADSGSGSSAGSSTDTGSTSPTPAASISAETRSGDENICSDLPDTVKYGGHP